MKHSVAGMKQAWANIPGPIRLFFLRGLAILLIWKIAYVGYFEQKGTLDKPLTQAVAAGTAWVFNVSDPANHYQYGYFSRPKRIEGTDATLHAATVYNQNQHVIGIASECNGLEVYVLYLGFLISFPASVLRKTGYGIGGLLFLHSMNVLRCVGLGYINLHHRSYFHFAHHYLFQISMYLFILLLWYFFTRGIKLGNDGAE